MYYVCYMCIYEVESKMDYRQKLRKGYKIINVMLEKYKDRRNYC